MSDSHSHTHYHDHNGDNFNNAFLIAIGLNLLFVLIEAVFAIGANSMSLLADAGHNLGDVLGLGLAWIANWLMTLPSNQKYSYGYKRTTILAALSNALLLILASLFIVYESIQRLIALQAMNEITVMIVAFIGIFINGGTALLFMKGRHGDINIKGAYLHLAYDALISVGVVIAGGLILLTGWFWLDPAVGILIVVVILFGTWGLLRDSINLIMDGVPAWVDQPAVKNYLADLAGVREVHDLHIWGLSTRGAALTVHLIVPEHNFSDERLHEVSLELKQRFKIEHATIQIEQGSGEYPCHHIDSCA